MPTWVSWAFVYRSFRVRGYALVVPETLSAVVISYNRAAIIGTCLRALGFADEVIVVDKSSTDATPEIAARTCRSRHHGAVDANGRGHQGVCRRSMFGRLDLMPG